MRWIFVRNAVNSAVNICKKCGEMLWIIFFTAFNAFTAFLTKIHRIHRISYKKKYPKTSTRVANPHPTERFIFLDNMVLYVTTPKLRN